MQNRDPLTVAYRYVDEVNDVVHLPVYHPPGDPIPLALSFSYWGNLPRVGVVLDGHKLIVNDCTVEHEILNDEHDNRIEQQILIYWGHGSHYHAVTPLRVEVREIPGGFFLRMFTTVIPCAEKTDHFSVLALIEIGEGLDLKQALGE